MRRPVLVVHPSNDVYGSDRSVRRTVEALEREQTVVLVVPRSGPLDELAGPRVHVRHAPFAVLRKADATVVWKQVLLLLRLCTVETALAVARLKRMRPAVVYVNTIVCPQWIIAARLLRLPVVTHVRELERGLGRLAQRALLGAPAISRALVANSTATAAWLVDAFPALADKTSTVPNGIERPVAPASPPNRARLVVVGRLSERKGQHVALAALARVRRRHPQSSLVLVGAEFGREGCYEQALRAQARALGLLDSVHFVGEVTDQWAYYDAADIVLVPSLQEPFGNVAVEAGLSCRPVIASGVEGLRDIVDDHVTGLLVAPGDAAALGDAVSDLLDDEMLRNRLADAALVRCERDFSVAAYGQAVRDVVAAIRQERS